MPRKKKQTEEVFKIKKRTQELGETLARKMFKLQHNEPTINDVIERLIVLESYKFGLLNEQEHRTVLEFYGVAPVIIEDKGIKTIPHEFKDLLPGEIAEIKPLVSSNNYLPLGDIRMEAR